MWRGRLSVLPCLCGWPQSHKSPRLAVSLWSSRPEASGCRPPAACYPRSCGWPLIRFPWPAVGALGSAIPGRGLLWASFFYAVLSPPGRNGSSEGVVNTSRALPRKSRRARHLGECGFRWLVYDNQTVLTNGGYGSGRERCTFF
jgi:hypothetical protein